MGTAGPARPARRRHARPDYAEALLPSERFSDEHASDAEFFESRTEYDDPAHRGAHSKAMKMRMASISAGWEKPSSGEELHAAIHAGEPDDRQSAVIRSWEAETDEREIFEAFFEPRPIRLVWRICCAGAARCARTIRAAAGRSQRPCVGERFDDFRAENREAHAQTGKRIDDFRATVVAVVPRAAADTASRG